MKHMMLKYCLFLTFLVSFCVIYSLTQEIASELLELELNSNKYFLDTYQCGLCVSSVHQYLTSSLIGSKNISEITVEGHQNYENVNQACLSLFPGSTCDALEFSANIPDINFRNPSSVGDSMAREICRVWSKCPQSDSEELQLQQSLGDITTFPDVRVSKAMGTRGYKKMRISVIGAEKYNETFFSYRKRFQYRWTDKFLSTGIVSVTPGATTTFTIAGHDYNIYLPQENEGVRGLIFADPCFNTDWVNCYYKQDFHTFNHSIELLNAVFSHHREVNYWQILGDNFYDRDGHSSHNWFKYLIKAVRSTPLAVVPGNHDFWVHGNPTHWTIADQQGNGFMQFYGQDTIAATTSTDPNIPYDFTINPDSASKGPNNLPKAKNFMFYHKIGNTAFIGFSGAHPYHAHEQHFKEACQWLKTANPDVILLLGHYNTAGGGCDDDTTVPAVYQEILQIPECQEYKSRFRYFMGHKHCNIVTKKDIGFLIGGQGMGNEDNTNACSGEYGFAIVDTTAKRFRVYYFAIAKINEFDHYNKILNCISQSGVSQCYHLAQLWADVPLV